MKVIWIDPGETVGYAVATADEDGLHVTEYDNEKLREFALWLLPRAATFDIIGFETYTIFPGTDHIHAGGTCPTLQLVGMIRLAAWKAQADRGDGRPVIAEQPTNAKQKGRGAARLYTPELVPVIEEALAGRHDDGHYGDALTHLTCWYHGSINRPKGTHHDRLP